ASDSAGVHRRTGGPVRVLPEWRDPDGESAPRRESEGGRSGHQAGDVDGAVPLLRALADVRGDQALWEREVAMTISGGEFLQVAGTPIGYCAAGGGSATASAERPQGQFDTRNSHVDPRRLDSWIAIAADGSVTAKTGKAELGQGMYTAQLQLIA